MNLMNLMKFKYLYLLSMLSYDNVYLLLAQPTPPLMARTFISKGSFPLSDVGRVFQIRQAPVPWSKTWKYFMLMKTFFHLFPSGVCLIMYIKEIRHEGLWERGCGYLTTSSRSAVGRSGGSGNPPEPGNPPPCSRTMKKNEGVTPSAIFQEKNGGGSFWQFHPASKCLKYFFTTAMENHMERIRHLTKTLYGRIRTADRTANSMQFGQ